MSTPRPPALRRVFTAEVDVDDPLTVGPTGDGARRVVPIRGGQVHGTGVSGRVLAGGADFQLLVADTAAHLEARYLLRSRYASERKDPVKEPRPHPSRRVCRISSKLAQLHGLGAGGRRDISGDQLYPRAQGPDRVPDQPGKMSG